MQMIGKTLLAALFASALAADPLTKDNAVLANLRMEKLSAFTDAQTNLLMTNQVTACKAAATAFATNCASVTEESCKSYKCEQGPGNPISNPSQYKTQSACTTANGQWQQDWGNTPRNACCQDNRKECGLDAQGQELLSGCCSRCNDAAFANHPHISSYCHAAGLQGPSVCGMPAGKCNYCSNAGKAIRSQSECTWSGTCSVMCSTTMSGTSGQSHTWSSTCMGSSMCTSAGGTWTPGVWMLNSSAVTEPQCYANAYCGKCSSTMQADQESTCTNERGSCQVTSHMDRNTCLANGQTWTPGTWTKDYTVKSESACEAKGSGYSWQKEGRFNADDSAKPIPASPMVAGLPIVSGNFTENGGCSTGGTVEIPGLLEGLSGAAACMNDTIFKADADAGMTAAAAIAANPAYYSANWKKTWRQAARAILTNNATNVVDRAGLILSSTACFYGLLEPKNNGKVTVNGGAATNVLISNPTNFASADAIAITGGSVTILGGTSAGAITAATTGKIELYGVANSGAVAASLSQDILIAGVSNLAAGTVTVTDATATLINVVNEGTVTVMGPATGVTALGGKYNAFDIVNNGNIVIQAGAININTICPSAGTMTISAGVTGTVTYETGCMGTITNNAASTVTVSAIDKQQTVISGDIAVTVPDADAFLTDTVAHTAVEAGIAETAGVPPAWVTVTVVKATGGRRLNGDSDRRLAGTAVVITFTITIPQTASSSQASMAGSKMKAATPAMITTKVQAKVTAAKGSSFTISVSSKTAPTVASVPTTTTTTTVAASSGSSSGTTGNATSATGATTGTTDAGMATLPSFSLIALVGAMLALAK